jgi:ABC-2 type transport system permease protein
VGRPSFIAFRSAGFARAPSATTGRAARHFETVSKGTDSACTLSHRPMPRLLFELARRGYRRYAAYPGATWAGVVTNTVFGLITAYVFLAVFRERETVGSYDARDAVTYVWLASGLLMTVYLWGWHEVALRVRSGDVATDLQRPLDLQVYWLAQDLGRAVYHGIFRGVPPFLVGALLFEVLVPG